MLAKLQRIAGQLATITDVNEAKQLRDKAEAIRVYARQQQDCQQIERDAAIIRLRAERQLGKLLSTKVRAGNPNCSPGGQLPTGISRKQSSQWQTMAKLPQQQFEEYLDSRQPTTKGVIQLAVDHRRERENAQGPDSGGKILTGDMWQLFHKLEDDSVDLFLTDPPYAETDCYGMLAELAAAKLKPGGLCLAYSGKYHLPEIMSLMGQHLDYWWMVALPFASTHNAIHPRRIQSAWKPILMYAKGKPDNPWMIDLLEGGGHVKTQHEWEQPISESEYLIEKLTTQGQLVVDPFCGSGTTLKAAKKLGRNYLGCELDSNTARGARRRLAA